MTERWRMLAAAVVGVLVLAGCAATEDPPGDAMAPAPTGAADPTGSPAAPTGSDEGDTPAPPAHLEFEVATVDGDTYHGADLMGQPAVLWFWAPWCGICAGQASEVAALARDYADTATVVGVAGLDDSVEAMQGFVDRHDLQGVTHLADSGGAVWQLFEVTRQSTFVILDESGAVVERGISRPGDLPPRLDDLAG